MVSERVRVYTNSAAVPLQYSMRIRTSQTLSDTAVIVESR